MFSYKEVNTNLLSYINYIQTVFYSGKFMNVFVKVLNWSIPNSDNFCNFLFLSQGKAFFWITNGIRNYIMRSTNEESSFTQKTYNDRLSKVPKVQIRETTILNSRLIFPRSGTPTPLGTKRIKIYESIKISIESKFNKVLH